MRGRQEHLGNAMLVGIALALVLLAPKPAFGQGQNPSPMVETTRAHERLERIPLDGITRTVPGPDGQPVELFVPASAIAQEPFTLVVHFHGASWIPAQAVARLDGNLLAATVNLGAGSRAYDRAFSDPAAFDILLEHIAHGASEQLGAGIQLEHLALSAFSAGHGAVRAILRDSSHFAAIGSVLLMDGMHTSYVPEARVRADGGVLDAHNLEVFARLASAAMTGRKRFLVTHSEIFPGTFASTTETADWLLDQLGLHRAAVLEWGPRGMQQLSSVAAGSFELRGYAGNSAPDHVDHFHAMPELLESLLR